MTCIACSKCGVCKPPTEFHKNAAAPGGLRLECKACRKLKAIADYHADPTKSRQRSRAWAVKNPERVRAAQQRHNNTNREARRAASRNWQKANRVADATRSAQQRAEKRRATPAWADRARIADIYALARIASNNLPWKFHVDHSIPLKHPAVCGLHVEHNLTVLLAETNIQKGNQYGGGLSQ